MKKAVIVVGKPNAGKSTTIRNFKRLVNMQTFHVFTLNGKHGYILATSFEEAERDIEETVKKRASFDFLIFACQGPRLATVHNALKAAAFRVREVGIASVHEAPNKAKEILNYLN